MDKPAGFQSDLAAMHDEMEQVAKLLEVTRPKAAAKTVDVTLGAGRRRRCGRVPRHSVAAPEAAASRSAAGRSAALSRPGQCDHPTVGGDQRTTDRSGPAAETQAGRAQHPTRHYRDGRLPVARPTGLRPPATASRARSDDRAAVR